MNESQNPVFTDAELEASLQGLGATELEQRLEFAPLLAGSLDGAEGADVSVCCSCKIPPDTIFGTPTPWPRTRRPAATSGAPARPAAAAFEPSPAAG
ncbi:MAG: hypothetical protein IPJ24_15080 [bacterium]|nr:hypothetical protein [bacterium]